MLPSFLGPDPLRADDDYKNPADTLPGHFMSSKASPPGGGRKFQIEQRKDAGQDEYTPVFDSLGPGKAEWIGEPVIWPRGHSDLSPLVKQFSGDNMTRKGRMESQRKKKPKLNRTVNNNDDNERNSPDGDAKGVESAGSASPAKSKEFEVLGSMSDFYAVVALVDKKQYRTEADMMKN